MSKVYLSLGFVVTYYICFENIRTLERKVTRYERYDERKILKIAT